VVLAEMGDKTQFLAMAFAIRHNVYKVFLGFSWLSREFAITATVGQLLKSHTYLTPEQNCKKLLRKRKQLNMAESKKNNTVVMLLVVSWFL
jgi:putative Ca2+/H+ antiporter (TMEM165/GDT1 family)